MLRYCIIGIDALASTTIISELSNSEQFDFVGKSKNPEDLLDIILANSPNVIFTNVDHYNADSYSKLRYMINDLYRSFSSKPCLIALASSDKQAYDCIKNDFFDYLIQPLDSINIQKLAYKLRTTSEPTTDQAKKLCLQSYSDYRFIEMEDIIFLRADNNNTQVIMSDHTKVVAYKTLKHFETILPKTFKRIHQSFIINQKYISRIHLGKSQCYLKSLKTKLPFSKSYKNVVAELANKLSADSVT